MKHVKAFLFKFIISFILLYAILSGINGFSIGDVFWTTMILGGISYILGDLLILPRTNNILATIADLALSFIIIWAMTSTLAYGDYLARTFTSALGMTIFEALFHRYMVNRVLPNDKLSQRSNGQLQYQMEASEELDPKKTKK
ncbi:YndM family protein [Priestia filamentosa]|uniref:YndM family protein n=1 Tax=Priestia filamentosa TaxID=1402861 RepID=UPI00397ACEFB